MLQWWRQKTHMYKHWDKCLVNRKIFLYILYSDQKMCSIKSPLCFLFVQQSLCFFFSLKWSKIPSHQNKLCRVRTKEGEDLIQGQWGQTGNWVGRGEEERSAHVNTWGCYYCGEKNMSVSIFMVKHFKDLVKCENFRLWRNFIIGVLMKCCHTASQISSASTTLLL